MSAQNPQLEGGERVPDPDCDISRIKATRASVGRAEGRIDLHDVSWELAYRARMEKLFSQTTTASACVGLVGVH